MAINKNKVMDSARKLRDKGQTDKAIKEYLKIVQEDPKDVRVWLKIGDLYVKQGNKAEATETYLKVAKFYGEQGFYLKAVAVYKQILKLDPKLVEVNLKLAELYRQLGLLQDAVQHFEMVAAHFHREGKSKEALATIRQLVDLDPENVATRIKLAELYSKEGATDEAVTEFAQACDFLRKQGRIDDLIKVAERLLWHKADDLPLNRELAGIYLKRNDARRALQKLQICFKANPRDLETLAQLAQAFQALDQKAKTVSVLKEMARVLVENGQRAQAEDVHRKILAYAPNDPDARAFLGDKPAAAAPAPERPAARAAVAEAVMAAAPAPAPTAAAARAALARTGALPLVRPESFAPPPVAAPPPAARRQVDDDFINELALEDDVAFEAESSVRAEAHSEEIAKILTEADVYVKYGLHQKAIDHLRKVYELDSGNLEASERLKDIFLAQGREPDAIAELLRMAETAVVREPDRATGYLREVLRLDGTNRRALDLGTRHRLDLTEEGDDLGAFEVEGDDGGAVAQVAEVDFDDLGDVSAEPASAELEGDGFEFELDDEAPVAAQPVTGTMEVSLDQVEEEGVAVADLDADDLDFDAVASSADGIGGEDFAFDPDDARAFDAAPGYPSPGVEPLAAGSLGGAALEPEPELEVEPEAELLGELDGLEIDPDETPVVDPTSPSADEGDGALDGLDRAAPSDPTRRVAITGDQPLDTGEAEAAAPPATGASLEDDLDEADFFVSQGLFAEARDILGGLARRHPGNPLVAAKLAEVAAAEGGEAGEDALLDALDAPSESALETPRAAPRAKTRPAVMLEKPLDEGDADTHFDLGLAYREMGLFDEAIKAFGKVRTVPGREVQSHLMVGMCHREQGSLSEAINQFKAALYVDRITPAEKFGLYYEIGTTYQLLDDPQEALYYYEMVLKKDAAYRDVAERVAAIRAAQGGGLAARPPQNTLDLETDDALDQLLGGK